MFGATMRCEMRRLTENCADPLTLSVTIRIASERRNRDKRNIKQDLATGGAVDLDLRTELIATLRRPERGILSRSDGSDVLLQKSRRV